jgi:squalene-hopene/tetraprenyl-beta-curcumene cyclase
MSPSLQVEGALASVAARAGDPLEAEYILLELWLHPPEAGVWNPPCAERIQRAAAAILARQLPDGGFGVDPGGPADASATVMAYFGLKLAGIPVNDGRLERVRDCVLALGGIERASSRVKINLSLFGLYPRQDCPMIAPETILLPGRARRLCVSLAIVQSFNPVRPVPAGFTLQELIPRQDVSKGRGGWDGLAKLYERHPLGWLRRMAVAKCRRWMLARLRSINGLGATFHSLLYSILALDLLGYPPEHPDRAAAQAQLERLIVDRDGQFRIQPCIPRAWSAAIGACGPVQAGSMGRNADWLLAMQSRDGGWAAFDGDPDATSPDATGCVLEAIATAPGMGPGHPAVRRAVGYLVSHQEPDGSWAGSRGNYIWGTFLALRGLRAAGMDNREATVLRGGEWLRSIQNADGGWGESRASTAAQTAWALLGLMAGGDWESLSVRQGMEYLMRAQQEDGGRQEEPDYPLQALAEYRKAASEGNA